jgi:hypothetical protein
MSQKGFLIGPQLVGRIKETIARVDSLPQGGIISAIPTRFETTQSYQPKVFRVCTATGAWPVDSSKEVTLYGVTATPNTVSVLNKLVSLPAPKSTATSRIVNIAKDGTQWYLVSFQMSSKTAVMASASQTITFLGAAATSKITFISPSSTQLITFAAAGSDVSIVTDISATLNTSNCSITVNKTTANIKTVGATQTATTVSASGTQTATLMSASGTQTAVVTTGTFTATFVSLEI